jgi:hypothetical protein
VRAQLLWPATLRGWLPGLLASVPLAVLLVSTRGGDSQWAALTATAAVVVAIPWVVPATMLLAVLSAPVYMWLHTQGPVPAVLDWLGGVVLVAAVVGCHLNTAWLWAWHRARTSGEVETGLRDFLSRHAQRK